MSVERPMVILQRSADLVALLAERGALVPAEIAEYVDTPRSKRVPARRRSPRCRNDRAGSRRASQAQPAVASVGRCGPGRMSEWDGARQVLDELAGATRQTVFLSVPRANESICVDWARGEAINVLLLKPGRSLPLYAGAAGRVTLAFGQDDPEAYLANAPFEAYTDRTLTTAAKLRKDIALTRTQGYVVSDGDVTEGSAHSGRPCSGRPAGEFAGALSIAGLAEELNERRDELVEKLLAAASKLSASLP